MINYNKEYCKLHGSLRMIKIIKASGEIAPFDSEKLRASLMRVGAYDELIDKILDEVKLLLHEGMTTHEIYRIAFNLLRQKSRALAAKYHLKRAIMRLGITGYPFEKYFAEIMRNKDFKSKNNQIIKGYCVEHEVDVIASKVNKIIFIECKYHNTQGKKCTVKIPLYVKGRFIDILEKQKKDSHVEYEMWLVTNTRFTTDAIKYGRCAGLHLIGWDYPPGNSLKEEIEISGLYPITCITEFSKKELEYLFSKNIVLCQSIHNSPSILNQLKISLNKKNSILNQCKILCHAR